MFADAIGGGGLVHVYARDGPSRVAVEELCVRMGALTGFHALLQVGLTTFTDVVGANGLRLNQTIEKVEGLGAQLLSEYDFAPGNRSSLSPPPVQPPPRSTSPASGCAVFPESVDCHLARAQSEKAAPKHSSGENLHHVLARARRGILLDNGMPVGDTSVVVEGGTGTYPVCPVSTIGAVSIVQCLNELTLRELDRRGIAHHVLRNMHLRDTRSTYDEWLRDQRMRYARALHNPPRIRPAS